MTAHRDDYDDYDYDEDDFEDAWDEDAVEDGWLPRPRWLHPDCVNVCTALELGTCCKYPDNPLVRVAVDLASAVEAAGREADGAPARLFAFVPGLLAQVHAILPRLNPTAVAQLGCPVGRLAGALDEAPGQGADLEHLRPLLAECSTALRTALGCPSVTDG